MVSEGILGPLLPETTDKDASRPSLRRLASYNYARDWTHSSDSYHIRRSLDQLRPKSDNVEDRLALIHPVAAADSLMSIALEYGINVSSPATHQFIA